MFVHVRYSALVPEMSSDNIIRKHMSYVRRQGQNYENHAEQTLSLTHTHEELTSKDLTAQVPINFKCAEKGLI